MKRYKNFIKVMMSKSVFVTIIAFAMILFCFSCSTNKTIISENKADKIIGVWKFSSGDFGTSIEVRKIITKGYFVCFYLRNNVIITSFGGTCSFDGETYIENINFGTQNRNDIGRTGTFKIRFEDNKMYLSGLVSGDNRVPFSEIWERLE